MTDEPIDLDRDMAERWYGSDKSLLSSYGPAIKHSMDALSDATGLSAEDRDATMTELARAFHDARIEVPTASRIAGRILHHLHAPPDEPTRQAWYTETNKKMREQYGDDAPRRMEAAKQFVANRPALRHILAQSLAGDHPDVVLAIAAQVSSLRIKPPARPAPGESRP